jgi:uncharacterized protein (TIGR00369 family)
LGEDIVSQRTNELLHMFNEGAPIAQYLGMTLSFTDEDNAIVDLPYNPNLDHALAGIHGGVYATMLDTAGWFTAAATHAVSCWLATAEMSIHFLLPARETSLRAVGRLLKQGKRQDVVEMHLYDGENRLVGHATGSFVVLPTIPIDAQNGARSELRSI